jgi:hypothetical protein
LIAVIGGLMFLIAVLGAMRRRAHRTRARNVA